MSESDKIRLDPATLRFVAKKMRDGAEVFLAPSDPMSECLRDMAAQLDELAAQETARPPLLSDWEAMSNARHNGIHLHRLRDNPEEQRFAEAWRAMQEHGRQLDWLLTVGSQSRCPPSASERDEVVAATVIQWLGSPVGRGYLRDLGYERRDR